MASDPTRHLAAIIESTPDFVAVSRPDGHVTYINAAGRRLLGIAPDADVTVYTRDDLCPDWAHARARDEWIPAALRDGTVSGECALRALDGREIPVAFTLHVHRDARGEVEALSTMARDISERRRAEAALRRSDARFRRIFESDVIGLVVADFAGRLREANDAFLRMVGYTQEDVRAGRLNSFALTPPEYAERDRQAVETMRRGGAHAPYEKEYLRKDGGRVPVLVGTVRLAPDADGTEVGIGFLLDLTQRRQVERALRRSEERFRSLMEQAPFSVQLFAPDGRTLRVNRAFEALWGLTLEQLRDYNVLEDPQLEARGLLTFVRRAFEGEVVRIPEVEYDPSATVPGGGAGRRWVSAVAYPLRDPDGNVREVVLVHEDVTAKVRAEHALRESDEQFRLLADTIPQLAWMARPDGHVFWYNRRWYEYTGTTPGQTEGWGWEGLHDPRVLPEVLERWRASLAHGEPFDMVFPLRGADGVMRPFLTRVNPLRDESGAVRRWFGTNTDISEQKQAEDASRFLADASSTLATVVDYQRTLEQVAALAVPRFADWCAVDMVDPDGGLRRLAVAHADPAKVRLAHELHRRYPPDPRATYGVGLVARTGESELRPRIEDALLVAAAWDPEHLALVRALGLRSYMCVAMKARGRVIGVITFVAAESGRQYGPAQLALAEQLAGRAAVAIENARLYEELRQADRRKDEFLAMLAHELRNPLAPLRTALEILKLPEAEGAIATRARETMERQVHHLTRLVDDLLDVSRVMRGKIELRRERVSLGVVVAHAVEAARPAIDAQAHELTLSAPEAPPVVDADPVRLTQAVANLLTNAAKYTPRGGHIRLSVTTERGSAVVTVEDDGVGIAPDLLPRVFDLFVQGDNSIARSQGGLGIGLTLVRSLVEMHGGAVEAASPGPGRGSRFTLRLPLAP